MRTGCGARFCNLTLTVGRESRSFLDRDRILALLPDWLKAADSGKITKLQITGKEAEDGKAEMIDLIAHQEKREIELPVGTATRFVKLGLRWKALVEFCNDFTSE